MANAKTKTKVVRYLLIEKLEEKRISFKEFSEKIGVERTSLYNLINCRRDGDFATWRKIQEALSLKDSEMWGIIFTTKRIHR